MRHGERPGGDVVGERIENGGLRLEQHIGQGSHRLGHRNEQIVGSEGGLASRVGTEIVQIHRRGGSFSYLVVADSVQIEQVAQALKFLGIVLGGNDVTSVGRRRILGSIFKIFPKLFSKIGGAFTPDLDGTHTGRVVVVDAVSERECIAVFHHDAPTADAVTGLLVGHADRAAEGGVGIAVTRV